MRLTLADRWPARSDPCQSLADLRRMNAAAHLHAADRCRSEADRRASRSDPCQGLADRHGMNADAVLPAADHPPTEADHPGSVADHVRMRPIASMTGQNDH